jgi:hypothetical protein
LRDVMTVQQGLLSSGGTIVSEQDSFVHDTPP